MLIFFLGCYLLISPNPIHKSKLFKKKNIYFDKKLLKNTFIYKNNQKKKNNILKLQVSKTTFQYIENMSDIKNVIKQEILAYNYIV